MVNWLDKRAKSWPVYQDITSRPSLQDMSNPDFFASKARNWDRIFGGMKDDLDPKDNPRAWWVAGLFLAHYPGNMRDAPVVRNRPELQYGAVHPGQRLPGDRVSEGNFLRPATGAEMLFHTVQGGFLREKDVEWIVKELSIPKN